MEKDPFLLHLYMQISNDNVQIPEKIRGKIFDTLKLLFVHRINRESFESQCFQGLPEECNGLRSLSWKVLLGYLPDAPSKWKESLEESRKQYENYINLYILPRVNSGNNPVKKETPIIGKAGRSQSEATNKNNIEETKTSDKDSKTNTPNTKKKQKSVFSDDHPLSTSTDSQWNSHFKDQKLWEDIVKDTKRTRSSTDFFRGHSDYSLQKLYCHDLEFDKVYKKETHIDVLTRILFIYGKLNPSVGYMQGMNEVLAPIYYCFYNDLNSFFIGRAEADAFHCFSMLMKDIQDGFQKKLDNTEGGIQTRVKTLNEMLKKIDKQLWGHLEKYKVNPQYYSLRWLMLLLAQEFSIHDTLKVWDRLFSHPKKMDYINYLCLAMIEGAREPLIQADDFATIMETLQKDVNQDMDKIFATGFRLYKQYAKPEETVSHIVLQE